MSVFPAPPKPLTGNYRIPGHVTELTNRKLTDSTPRCTAAILNTSRRLPNPSAPAALTANYRIHGSQPAHTIRILTNPHLPACHRNPHGLSNNHRGPASSQWVSGLCPAAKTRHSTCLPQFAPPPSRSLRFGSPNVTPRSLLLNRIHVLSPSLGAPREHDFAPFAWLHFLHSTCRLPSVAA